MDEEEQVMAWITSAELDCDMMKITEHPKFDHGKCVEDQDGDYIIVYFHPKHRSVVYTFKGNEDIYFMGGQAIA